MSTRRLQRKKTGFFTGIVLPILGGGVIAFLIGLIIWLAEQYVL